MVSVLGSETEECFITFPISLFYKYLCLASSDVYLFVSCVEW